MADGRYVLYSPDLDTQLEAGHIRREHHELRCQLVAHTDLYGIQTVDGRLFLASVNLLSLRDRDAVARSLYERTMAAGFELMKWRQLVDELAIRVAETDGDGELAVVLRDRPRRQAEPWLRALGFSLPARLPSMLFGDGDALKTMTLDALAVDLARQGVNVGIVDAEMTADDHAERVARLSGGEVPGNLVYLSCMRPLVDECDRVTAMVRAHQLDYLFFDSVGFLCHALRFEFSGDGTRVIPIEPGSEESLAAGMVARVQIPGVIRLGRRVLFRSADLLDWLDHKRTPSPRSG